MGACTHLISFIKCDGVLIFLIDLMYKEYSFSNIPLLPSPPPYEKKLVLSEYSD